MRVYVNDRNIDLLPGMSVKHALIRAGFLGDIESGKKVCDEWGNEIGLDGALAEGVKIYVESQNEKCKVQSSKCKMID
jgi:hypothetical protein